LPIDPSDPATLYAGSTDGVFKSTDGGATSPSIRARSRSAASTASAGCVGRCWGG